MLSKADSGGTSSQDNKVGGGGAVTGAVTDVDGKGQGSNTKSRRMSRKMSMKEPTQESDRQLKKLFRAIQDGDVNLVGLDSCFCTSKSNM